MIEIPRRRKSKQSRKANKKTTPKSERKRQKSDESKKKKKNSSVKHLCKKRESETHRKLNELVHFSNNACWKLPTDQTVVQAAEIKARGSSSLKDPRHPLCLLPKSVKQCKRIIQWYQSIPIQQPSKQCWRSLRTSRVRGGGGCRLLLLISYIFSLPTVFEEDKLFDKPVRSAVIRGMNQSQREDSDGGEEGENIFGG